MLAVPDRDRRDLYEGLRQQLGEARADTLMALLPPSGWADVARTGDLDAVRTELGGEIAELRGELHAFRGEVKGEIAELRAALKTQLPRIVAANVATVVASSGLVFSIARAV